MYGYTVWPGAYSFREEIGLFIEFVKQQIDDLAEKIEQTEKALEAQLFDQDMKEIEQYKAHKLLVKTAMR